MNQKALDAIEEIQILSEQLVDETYLKPFDTKSMQEIINEIDRLINVIELEQNKK
jgi:hypothetical protein